MEGIAAVLGGDAADDGAEQDGDEGRAFDQGVAGGEFRTGEMIGQDAVLDRTEQRGDHAEQEQRDEQQQHRMNAEAEHRDEGNADLSELEPPRHHRLVVAIREFAAERGQKEIGRDENRGGERDQRFCVGAPDVEQNEKDQGVLEEIVAEGGKELGPEQGREAPRQEQGRGHGGSGGWIGRGGPNDYRDKLRLPTGAKGLKDDNLGKRTIGRPPIGRRPETHANVWFGADRGSKSSQGCPDPDRRVGHYPRRVRWPAGCIMIAATLRQTAAPVANVKSEIHMA